MTPALQYKSAHQNLRIWRQDKCIVRQEWATPSRLPRYICHGVIIFVELCTNISRLKPKACVLGTPTIAEEKYQNKTYCHVIFE